MKTEGKRVVVLGKRSRGGGRRGEDIEIEKKSKSKKKKTESEKAVTGKGKDAAKSCFAAQTGSHPERESMGEQA